MPDPDLTYRVAGTVYEPDDESVALHDRAEALLAERLRIQGRGPKGYTEAEYVDALEEAGTVLARDRILEKALEGMGIAPPGKEIVDEGMLRQRYNEIVAERFPGPGEQPTEEQAIEIMQEVIEELGAPGERRKDLDQKKADAATRLVAAAVQEGKIAADEVPGAMRIATLDPAGAARLWGVAPVAPGESLRRRREPEVVKAMREFTLRRGGDVMGPDEESTRRHVAAEKILAHAGLIDRDGAKSYSRDQYVKASEIAEECGALDELERADWLRPVTAGLLFARRGIRDGEWKADDFLGVALHTAAPRVATPTSEAQAVGR